MVKIMFVCLGNICRSPMAEFVFKDMVKGAGLEQEFLINSSATSTEELGNPIYPPAAATLRAHSIPFGTHRASQITRAQIEEYDYIIGMEQRNISNIMRISGGGYADKVYRLLDFAGGGDITDPWYSGDFERTYEDIVRGCKAFLQYIKTERKI